MHKLDGCCDSLIETTAGALNDDVVALMLLAVQRSSLALSVNLAIKRWVDKERNFYWLTLQGSVQPYFGGNANDMKRIVKECLVPFPYIWASVWIMNDFCLLIISIPFSSVCKCLVLPSVWWLLIFFQYVSTWGITLSLFLLILSVLCSSLWVSSLTSCFVSANIIYHLLCSL